MILVVLAGGGGTRLFPLSRTSFPKQFLKIEGEKSLFIQTILRFLPVVSETDIIVITNRQYLQYVSDELEVSGLKGVHVISEPVGRNTAPAIALAVRYCIEILGVNGDEVMLVTPADHVIHQGKVFVQAVRQADDLAQQDKIVTFGIKPDKPETGYGYIEIGEQFNSGYLVKSFTEKPDIDTANKYLAASRYYWNSGMFAFRLEHIMAELAEHYRVIYDLVSRGYEEALSQFNAMPNISIDYAVVEKSKNVVIIPLTAYWSDIGSWDAIYDVLNKDGNGNVVKGECIPFECTNSLLFGRNRLIAGIGLRDILVVETDDVVVVAKKGESQKVKDLVGELKKRGRREVDETTTIYRSWGNYTILGKGTGYKIKKVVVNPKQQLSLQLHYHRSEHWIVISGTAQVKVNDELKMVHENESIFIPMSTIHQLENPGRIPLEIIEVQNGKYLEEDDILRM